MQPMTLEDIERSIQAAMPELIADHAGWCAKHGISAVNAKNSQEGWCHWEWAVRQLIKAGTPRERAEELRNQHIKLTRGREAISLVEAIHRMLYG